MKYALLVYPGTTQEAIGKLSGFEQAAIMTEYRRLAEEFGIERCVQFHPAETATAVRFEDGRRLILDAAYGSPDIGCLYLLEAEHIDRALELAERIPAARLGGAVEIRPIADG